MEHANDRTFGIYETARTIGRSGQRIRVLLSEGRVPGARKVKGQWRIPAETVEQMRAERQEVSA